MGWNGNAGEIRSKAPTKQFREGFDQINWKGRKVTVVKTTKIPTPEHLRGTIYDDNGQTNVEMIRGRGPDVQITIPQIEAAVTEITEIVREEGLSIDPHTVRKILGKVLKDDLAKRPLPKEALP